MSRICSIDCTGKKPHVVLTGVLRRAPTQTRLLLEFALPRAIPMRCMRRGQTTLNFPSHYRGNAHGFRPGRTTVCHAVSIDSRHEREPFCLFVLRDCPLLRTSSTGNFAWGRAVLDTRSVRFAREGVSGNNSGAFPVPPPKD